jgi:catechol 2,3-dioxygenase-like lactoylglutathione lyase family enzyme
MLGSAPVIAFVPATDLDVSCDFYSGVLGLEVTEISPFACVLNGSGTMVRVTKVDQHRPQPFTVLGWAVTDIAVAVSELTSLGVTFTRYQGMEQDHLGVWATPGGDQIAWFRDPDGNVLSLTQFTCRDAG